MRLRRPFAAPPLPVALGLALALAPALATGCGGASASSDSGPPGPPGTPNGRAHPPHIVVVLADDLGFGDPQCYNPDSKVATPHLDRLAAEGMLFTDAHSPSAVCSPTRYGLLTGRYCWRSPLQREVVSHFDPLLIEPETLTLPELLKRAGYATACIGKWHLGIGAQQPGDYSEPDRDERPHRTDYTRPLEPGPRSCGFDFFYGSTGKPGLFLFDEQASDEEVLASWFIENEKLLVGELDEWRQSEVGPILTRRAVRWIEESHAEEPDRPLFLYFAPTAVHEPLHPAKFVRGTSAAGKYGDFVAELDWSVGEILSALERAGIADDTLVLFTSDNGAARGTQKLIETKGHHANAGLRGWKRDIWEGGHRVPFLVRWPGQVRPGARSDALVCLTDLMATFAPIAGVELSPDDGVDSFDLGPLLTGDGTGSAREEVVLHSSAGEFALRSGEWKLIDCRGPGTQVRGPGAQLRSDGDEEAEGGPPGQLYDLAADPGERRNLYAKRPEVVQRMTRRLEAVRAGTGTR